MSGIPSSDLAIRCVIELNAEGDAVLVTRSHATSCQEVREMCALVVANDPVVRWFAQQPDSHGHAGRAADGSR